jgi:hypothetical protein
MKGSQPAWTRYTANILWARQGNVHGGGTWRLHCAYFQEEGNQELNSQQQPCPDLLWRAVDHFRVGDASTPCGRRPLWPSSTL